jgi:hypothetical protein
MENIFFSYYWFLDEKEEEVTSIRIYGIDENNNNICVRVNDFYPYIYLELPTNISWNASRVQLVGNKIDQLIPKNKPLKKIFEMKYKLYGADLSSNGERKILIRRVQCQKHNPTLQMKADLLLLPLLIINRANRLSFPCCRGRKAPMLLIFVNCMEKLGILLMTPVLAQQAAVNQG